LLRKAPGGLGHAPRDFRKKQITLYPFRLILVSSVFGRFPPGTLLLDRLVELPGGPSALRSTILKLGRKELNVIGF
jgi:hypothetical protein